MSQKHTVTAVVTDPASPWPLLYVIDANDPTDEAEIRQLVARQRYEDVIGDVRDAEESELASMAAAMEPHMVFEGDLTPVADFRG
jgi:hypothetical protein